MTSASRDRTWWPREDYDETFVVGLTKFPDEAQARLVHIKKGAGTMSQMGNILVVGPPGAGKTNLIVNNLLSWRHSAVVVDLKGSVYGLTANYRCEIGQKVYVLDAKEGTGHRFNPVAATPKALRYELAAELVSITNDDPFWSAVAVSMWLACWAAADHAGKPHIPYAIEIMNFEGVGGALEHFLKHHRDDPETMKHVLDFYTTAPEDPALLERMKNSPDRLLGSKWTTVKNSAQPLDNETFLSIFSGHDLDVEGMFYNGSTATVYVMADETKKRQFNAFARLVLKALGECLIREGDKEAKRRPVLFLYDEFGNAPLQSIVNWLTTMRSRDVILALFIQQLSQLSAGGQQHDFDDENSIHHHIFFKPLNPAGRISRIISEMSGKTSKIVRSGSSSGESYTMQQPGERNFSTSETWAVREGYVIEQEQIEKWPMSAAYAVLTQKQTEKYQTTVARQDLLGWALPPKAASLPKLEPYQPSKKAVRADKDAVQDLADAVADLGALL